jgi:hypothetical protein
MDGKLYPVIFPISQRGFTNLGLDGISGNGNTQSLIMVMIGGVNHVPFFFQLLPHDLVSWLSFSLGVSTQTVIVGH